MSECNDDIDTVLDEILDRHRRGERLDLDTLCAEHPALAGDLRRLVPAILLIENVRPDVEPPALCNAAARVPTQIGEYRILREIGRGGMGIVYDAEQQSLGRRVALKILSPHISLDESAVRRFQREARAAAQLHHTSIVPVFEVGRDEGTLFYAMQLIRGQSLDVVIAELRQLRDQTQGVSPRRKSSASTIQASGQSAKPDTRAASIATSLLSGRFQPIDLSELYVENASADEIQPPSESAGADSNSSAAPVRSPDTVPFPGKEELSSIGTRGRRYWRSVAEIGLQVADALNYSHARGIIHRDIKPSNLILDEAGVVWVTDFGLAITQDQGMSRTGDIVGTLRYMPPEQFHSRGDERSDVYSLGITLYELLTLRPAFQSSNQLKLIEMISVARLTSPRIVDPRIPRDLETIVLKACDKEPHRRYVSAKQMADDLQRFLDDQPILARKASAWEHLVRWSRSNRGLAASLALVFLLLLVLTAGSVLAASYFRNQRQAERILVQQKQREANRAVAAERLTALALYQAHMRMAGEALHRPGGMGQILNLTDRWKPAPGQPDLRDWEWYFLRSLCHRERLDLQTDLGIIWSVDWSPHGSKFAAAGSRGLVCIWDATSGNRLKQWNIPGGSSNCVRWSPDGARLAIAKDRDIVVWDVESEQTLVRVSPAHQNRIERIAWSPDGSRLASAALDSSVKVWNAKTGHPSGEFHHNGEVYAVAWSPDGSRIASGGQDQDIRIWDLGSGRQVNGLVRHSSSVFSLSWSPDGSLLASASQDQTVKLWHGKSGGHLYSFNSAYQFQSVAWDSGGERLATARWDGAVVIIDVAARRETHQLFGHEQRVWEVCWSPDGSEIVSASIGGKIKVWTVPIENESRALVGGERGFDSVAWNPDGSRLVATADSEVFLWDSLRDGARRFTPHRGSVRKVCWSPDGRRFATASAREPIKVWDAATCTLIHELSHKGEKDSSEATVAWSPNGQFLAAGWGDRLQLHDAASGEVAQTLICPAGDITDVEWEPDSQLVATGGVDGNITILHVPSGQPKVILFGHTGRVQRIRWSFDGTQIASAGWDQTVRIWDVESGIERQVMRGHTRPVQSVCWNRAGTRLASGGDDGVVRIWDAATGVETLALQLHSSNVQSVDWSADGKRIASGSWDATVRIWDATRGYSP